MATVCSTGTGCSLFQNASTVHSFFVLEVARSSDDFCINRVINNAHVTERILKTDMIGFDEIFQLSARVFSLCNAICMKIKKSNLLFGGLQIIG